MKITTNGYLTEMSVSEMVRVNGGETKKQKHEKWARTYMSCHLGGSVFQTLGHIAIEIFG